MRTLQFSHSPVELTNSLTRNSHVLAKSFDPQAPPPAASALVGPSYPREPRFSETLRSRWNLAVTRAVDGVRSTDFAAAGSVLVDGTASLAQRLGGEAEKLEAKVEDKVVEVGKTIKAEGEKLVSRVETAKENHVGSVPVGGPGGLGGEVDRESFTGGPGVVVRAKRASEGTTGRLV